MRYAIAVIILISGTAYAVPSISGISGQFNYLSTITISGSSFGTRGNFSGSSHNISSFMPIVWKDFEDNTLVSDGVTVESNHIHNWAVESTYTRNHSSFYGKRFWFDEGDGLSRISGLQHTASGATGHYFMSFWFRKDADSLIASETTGKIFRIWGNNSCGPENMWAGAQLANLSSECDAGGSTCCSPNPGTSHQSLGFHNGNWDRIDFVFEQSPDQAVMYINMAKIFAFSSNVTGFTNVLHIYNEQFVSNPFDNSGSTRFIFGHMMDSPSDGAPLGTYYDEDDLYGDYSFAHVEVCSKSTYSALISGGASSDSHCELQIPLSWSDGTITANFNTGAFNTGDTAYVYVVTDNGTAESWDVNANGFPITIGTTGTGGGGGGSPGVPHTGINGKSHVNGKAVVK